MYTGRSQPVIGSYERSEVNEKMRLHFQKGSILVFSLLAGTAAIASPANPVEQANQALSIIQAATPLKTEKFSFKIDDHVSGQITRRTYEGGLQKLIVSHGSGDSHGDDWTALYYRDGNLIYASEHSNYWSFGGTSEVDNRSEVTTVFDGGSCVQQLSKSVQSTSGTSALGELMKAATAEPVECGKKAIELAALASRLRTVRSKADIQARWESALDPKDRVLEIRERYQSVAGNKSLKTEEVKSSCTDVEHFEPSRSTLFRLVDGEVGEIVDTVETLGHFESQHFLFQHGELWFSYVEIRTESIEAYGISESYDTHSRIYYRNEIPILCKLTYPGSAPQGVTSGVIMERPCDDLSRIFGVGDPHQEGISEGLSHIGSSTAELAVRARRLLSLYRSGKTEGLRTWCSE
jgi:hypothetical protein